MELVQDRIISLAQSLREEAAMLDATGYFDEFGFDLEASGAQLNAKLKEYCAGSENIDELDPSVEDHPQPRRMARYLLENVEYEILEKPLSEALVKSKPKVDVIAIKTAAGDGPLLFGYPRNLVLALLLVVVLMMCAIGYVVMSSSSSSSAGVAAAAPMGGGGGGGGGRGGRKGGRRFQDN